MLLGKKPTWCHELIYCYALSITSQLPMNSKSATYSRLVPYLLWLSSTSPLSVLSLMYFSFFALGEITKKKWGKCLVTCCHFHQSVLLRPLPLSHLPSSLFVSLTLLLFTSLSSLLPPTTTTPSHPSGRLVCCVVLLGYGRKLCSVTVIITCDYSLWGVWTMFFGVC